MKKTMLIIFAVTIALCTGGSAANKYYNKHKEAVNKQHKHDIQNRDAILAALGAFLSDTNKSFSD